MSSIKTLIVFSVKIFAALVSFILNIALVRFLGAESSGIFFYFQTVLLFFSVVGTLGLQNLIVKESALGFVGKGILGFQLLKGIPVFLSAVSVFITAFFLLYWNYNHDFSLSPKTIVFLGASVFLYGINILLYSINQGNGSFITSVIFQSIFYNLFLLVFCLSFNTSFNLDFAIVCYFFSLFLAVIIQTILLVNKNLIKIKKIFHAKVNYKSIFIFSLPFMITVLSERAVILVIQFYLERDFGASAISYFTVLIRIVGIAVIVLSSVNVIVSRSISIAYKNEDSHALQTIANKASRILIPFSLVFFVTIILFSEHILGVFGDEFKVLKIPLYIVAFGQCINLMTGSVSLFLLMTENEKKMRNNLLFSFFVTTIFVLLFYSEFSVTHAAIAFSLYMIFSNLLSWYSVMKYLGINTLRVL